MKRFFSKATLVLALACAFAGVLVHGAAADEITEVYLLIYKDAEGLSQKYAAIVNLIGLQDKSIAPILATAIEELLLTQKNYTAPSDQETLGRGIRLLSKALGDFKHLDAVSFLWDVVQQVPDPLAKSEALISIGKLRALDYAERISLYLRDLNMKPTEDLDSGEKRAYGAIIALEKLKDLRGFSPVFFASEGWYSLRIRQQAERSLPNIAEDPTEAIQEIIRIETPERKLRALQAEASSKASAAHKAETATIALGLGHDKLPRDRVEAKTFADLRKLSLRALIGLKAQNPASIDSCKASYEKGYDDEERLLGLAALGANGSDPAATILRDIIMKMNSDQRSGITDETRNRMAKSAIENAALTKNRIVRAGLMSVVANDKWSGGIILAAQNALKAIP